MKWTLAIQGALILAAGVVVYASWRHKQQALEALEAASDALDTANDALIDALSEVEGIEVEVHALH